MSGPEVYTQNWESELEPMTQLPSKQISLDEPCVLFKPARKAFIPRKAVDALPPESRPCLLLCSKPQSRPPGLRKQRVSGRPLSSRDTVTRDLALQGLDLKFRREKGELCVMNKCWENHLSIFLWRAKHIIKRGWTSSPLQPTPKPPVK